MDDYTKVPRAFSIAPTDDKLKSDCIKLADLMYQQWDGEVDFIIVSTRRLDSINAQYATTIPSQEKIRAVLEWLLRQHPVSVKGKG